MGTFSAIDQNSEMNQDSRKPIAKRQTAIMINSSEVSSLIKNKIQNLPKDEPVDIHNSRSQRDLKNIQSAGK
jgi:hypothetical protein